MGSSSSPLPLSLTAATVLLLLLLLSHPAEANTALLHLHLHQLGGAAALCHHTDYPAVCLATAKTLVASSATAKTLVASSSGSSSAATKTLVASSSSGSSAAAAAALARMTIQAAIRKTEQASALADGFHRGAADGTTKSSLQVCRESYRSALSDLKTSMRALRNSAVADLQINLSSAITNVGTCDDGFAEKNKKPRSGVTPSPLSGVNSAIHRLSSNGLALSQILKP